MNYGILTDCAVAIAAISLIWFRGLAPLRRDNFRSDIRRIRDGLFDYMWQISLDFRDPAYRSARQSLNGLLRLSNSISPLKFFITVTLCREMAPPIQPESPNHELQKEIERARDRATHRLIHFLFLEGFVGVFVRMLLRCLAWVSRIRDLKDRVNNGAQRLINSAYRLGAEDLSPEDRAVLHVR